VCVGSRECVGSRGSVLEVMCVGFGRFWRKLDHFQDYYNHDRDHSRINLKIPKMTTGESTDIQGNASLEEYRLNSSCDGLYQLAVAV
jgi:hypothetical protein